MNKKSRALLQGHLENISWRVLEAYPVVVRELIRGRYGVYALYKKDRLYYVGLASNLSGRLKSHLRDRHRGAWDRFSVYLTIRSDHIKELESLLLRIINPTGNRTGGRFAKSENLFQTLNARIKGIDADRRAAILGGAVAERRRRTKARRAKGPEDLVGFAEKRVQLKGTYKGVTYRATLRRDGWIGFRRKLYESPTAAAREIVPHANGWWFWRFKSKDGEWVRLRTLRR